MGLRAAIGALVLLLAACGPNLGKLERGEKGRVEAVYSGDALGLDGGMRVLLAEIDTPRGEAPFAREARAELETLAQGRPVLLAYGGAKRARSAPAPDEEQASADAPLRETAIAHVFVQSEGGRWFWLQHEMVSRGAAYVRPRRANHARARELLAVEAEARAAKRGLWALGDYRTLNAASAAAAAIGADVNCRNGAAPYRIVEGRVADADVGARRASLTLEGGAARRSELVQEDGPAGAFSIVVFGEAFADWDGTPLFSLKGERVRARGALGMFRGAPQLCIDRSEQLEVLGRA